MAPALVIALAYLGVGGINVVHFAVRRGFSSYFLEPLFFLLLWPVQVAFAVAMGLLDATEWLYARIAGNR
jgi:hypothetical protein